MNITVMNNSTSEVIGVYYHADCELLRSLLARAKSNHVMVVTNDN